MTVIERPPLWQRLKPWLSGIDIPLLVTITAPASSTMPATWPWPWA
jgi:hypothetical protein